MMVEEISGRPRGPGYPSQGIVFWNFLEYFSEQAQNLQRKIVKVVFQEGVKRNLGLPAGLAYPVSYTVFRNSGANQDKKLLVDLGAQDTLVSTYSSKNFLKSFFK